jgi:hypothetical protein
MDVKEEVARLKNELRRDQDPDKMSRIQSQIGVSGRRSDNAGPCLALVALAPGPGSRADVQELMEQINVIREKAAEAEAIVKAITGDIQRLDVAKRNLTGAIQTLERWAMLSASAQVGTRRLQS